MTQEWKDKVERRLKELGKNRAWFAAQLGVTRGFVTKLLKKNPDGSMHQISSEAVPRICALLDLPPPLSAPVEELDEKRKRLLALIDRMPDSARDGLLATLEGLFKQK